jgi:hypothetical protein
MRSRVYDRIRALLFEDAELVADGLEDGELDPAVVAGDFTRKELGDSIADMVAAVYILGRHGDALDVEYAIQKGIERGKSGRVELLERRAEDEPVELTLAEWGELRNHSPELAERARRQVKQSIGLTSIFRSEEEFSEMVDDKSNE